MQTSRKPQLPTAGFIRRHALIVSLCLLSITASAGILLPKAFRSAAFNFKAPQPSLTKEIGASANLAGAARMATPTVTNGNNSGAAVELTTVAAVTSSTGMLDTTFNGTGKVTTAIGTSVDTAQGVAVQSDGKIVAVGSAFNTTSTFDNFAVVRYNTNGSLDTTFDTDGKRTDAIGTGESRAQAVAIQSDGKIVVAGYAQNPGHDFAVVRYNANGSLDTTFNTTGIVLTDISGAKEDFGYGLALQSDGKIAVVGSTQPTTLTDFAVVRYNTNGSLDTSFNTTGKVSTDFASTPDEARSVAIQSDGKIVVGGQSGLATFDFAVARYTSAGALDSTFNTTGKVTTSLSSGDDFGRGVAIQSDGKIVLGGYAGTGSNDFAVVRYTTSGGLDSTFNGTGSVTTAIGSGSDRGLGLVLQPDGNIVLAGMSNNGSNNDFAVVRYTTNGGLDTTFNTTGKVVTPIGAGNDVGNAVALQATGEIVVAGESFNGVNNDFAVVRYGVPSAPEIAVSETGVGNIADGGSFSFGSTAVGTPVTKTFTVTNSGAANLTLTPPISVPAGFTVTSTFGSTTVASGGGTTTFQVRMDAAAAGTPSGTLSFGNNDSDENPFNFTISGTVNASPPTISKAFGAASVPLNSLTSLTFTITNPNMGLGLTGVSFTDALPAGLVVAPISNVRSTCNGTVFATPSSTTISLSGGSLGVSPSNTCTISVDVTGTTAGAKPNSVSASAAGTGAGPTSSTVTLNVFAPPTVSKFFVNPNQLNSNNTSLNGTARLAIAITNPPANPGSLSGLAIADTFPAGLQVDSPVVSSNTCGGTFAPIAGATSFSFSGGGPLTPSDQCTIFVVVKATTVGAIVNTTGNVSSTQGGTGGTASGTLNVFAPPTIAKAFGASTIAANTPTTMSFTITNPAANPGNLTGVAFNDTLLSGLQIAPTPGLTNNGFCGSPTTTGFTAGSTSLTVSGATVTTANQCVITVNVIGTTLGTVNNTTTAITSTQGGTGATSNTATLTVASPPTVTKSFSPTQILVNGTSTLTINFSNPNASLSLTNLSITDSFPAGIEVDATPMATNTCGGTFNPTAAATSIGLSGGSLGTGAGNTCAISVKVKGTTAGDKINTTGNISTAETGQGGTASATLTVVGPPTISKGFGIPVNIATAPTGATESGNTVTITTTVAHSLAIGQRVLISGVGVAGYNGTFSIASVPSSTTFTYDNPTAGLAASGGGTASRVSVPLNSTTTMRFVLTNPNPSTTLNNVSFSDMLPSGITVASNGAGVSTCNGGTLVTTAPGTVSFTGGVLAAAASCTIDVTVTGATAGSWNNTTTAISTTETGTGTASNTANLLVVAPPAIVKSFNPAAIPVNGVTRLSFTISNPNPRILPSNESPLNEPATLYGVQFTASDMLPSGLQTANPSMATVSNCGSSQTMGLNPGNTSINLLNARVVIGFPCVVSLNVTATQAGTFNNSVTITSANGGQGNTSMATLTVANPPTVSKVFSPSLITPGGTSTLTVTLSNSNTFDLTGASVTDTLPVGVTTVGGTAATTCTGGTASQNSGSVSLSGGAIPMGGSCTLSVNVTSAANGIYTNTIAAGALTTANSGPNASPASAVLNVANPPTISKAFAPNPISSGGTGALTITLTNPNSNAPLTLSSPLTDTLPANVTTVGGTAATTCSGGTASQMTGSVTLTGGTIPANGSCTLTVNVTSSTVGGHLNTIAAGALVTNGGSNANPASATLFVGAAPLVTKTFNPMAIKTGATTTLTISIANNNISLPFNGVGFTDTLPGGLTVPDQTATPTCGGSLTVASNVITLTGATIAAGTTCTATFTATGATVGVKNNTVTVNTSNFGIGYTGTGTVTVYDLPTIAKSFAPTSVAFGGTSTMSFVLSNPNSFAGGNLTGLSFTDTLPSGIAVGNSGPTSVCGGTLTTTTPNMVSFSGGTLGISGPGNTCTINVTVTGAQIGLWANTVSSLTSTQTGTNAVSAMATLTVDKANTVTTITSDNPDSSATGQTVTVNFTVAAVAPGAGTPTGTVTITVSGGSEACTGTLAAGAGSCTLALTVAGSRTLTATYNGDTNFNGSTDTEPHTVVAPPVIAKSFNPTAVLLNGVSTLTLSITNPAANTVALTGVGVTDAFLPTAPGLVVHTTPAVMNSCATGTFNPMSGDTTLTISGATIPVGTTCNFSVQVRATIPGAQVNNTGQVTSTNGGTGNSASATLQANSPPTITAINLSRSAGSTPLTTTIATANDVETAKDQLVVKISTDGTNFFDSVTTGNVTIALVDQNAGAANVNPSAAGGVIATITTPCNATVGPINLFLRVTDSDGQIDTKPWTLTIIPNPSPVLSYSNQTVTAGTTPIINPATGPSDNGTLNPLVLQGVSPNNGGLMVSLNAATGTVTVLSAALIGNYTVTITATDNCNQTTTATLPITVVCPTIMLSPASLPNSTINAPYAQTITAAPAGTTYSFSVTSGLLPAGLTLNSNGSFSGAPTQSGVFNFRITATGFGGCTGFRDYTLTVVCSTITVSPANLPGGTVGTAYSQSVSASPAGSYTFSVSSGSLPTGLTLNASTGAITGTPTISGSFTFTITAAAGGCTGSTTYTVVVTCSAITLGSLVNGQVGNAYSQTISVSPAGSYSFSVLIGTLPSGLTLNTSTGLVSGLPTATGTYNFTIKADAGAGCSATQSYTLVISCPTIVLTPASLPGGSVGVAYSQALTASPAGGSYSFAVISGSLPGGLSLSASGLISGTPTANGTFNFTVTATGFGSCTGTQSYSLTVSGPTCPAITLSSLSGGTVGTAYSSSISASPSGSYTYAVTSGALPPGLTLYSSFALIFGYPTAAGTYNFTITATDVNGCTGLRNYSVVIGAGALPAALPEATVGKEYSYRFLPVAASSIRVATSEGAMPPGLALSGDNVLVGKPTQSGDFPFKLKAGEQNGPQQTLDLKLHVEAAAEPVLSGASITDPLNCTRGGSTVNVTATVANTSGAAQTANFTAALPATVRAVPGTCTTNVAGFNCQVITPSSVTASGTLANNQSVTITYQAQIADETQTGTQVCVTSTASFVGAGSATVQACTTLNCPTIGPGLPYTASSLMSDQKAGSVLIYNVYTSSSNPVQQNTRLTLTNTDPARGIAVHLFFVDGSSCSVADSFLCLTPNQTTSFLASDLDPGTTGYVVAVATDAAGCPVNFNFLVGDEYVKFATGHAANLAAEAISALAGGLPFCNQNSSTAQLNFDGISYNPVPRVLAIDNIPSRADGNDTLLILNRIGGNLGVGAGTLINLFGIIYDDQETGLSFGFGGSSSSPGTCQFRGVLSNTFPRTTPRFEQFIPAGRSGWLKVFSQADIGLLGAVINFNANAGTSAGAFSQGHNLHKLTLTSTPNYIIPVFPPGC